ncbi:MAG: replication-associated recombination protein A [Leptospiraceae bacterium]|nr:replication-associated recombination protein A [Leptospiraceae bacterium]
MDNLFSELDAGRGPLPARLRPRNWQEYAGQSRIRQQLEGQALHSMLLYGPPGCGKTSLAGMLAAQSGRPFVSLSAVSSGVKEVREVIARGKSDFYNLGQGVVLFLDEIHRFSKSQQDALLEAVEKGWIILIGATTENPAYQVNAPLLSRMRIYPLQPLADEELGQILKRAVTQESLQGAFDPPAVTVLIQAAQGDARRLLGFVEYAAQKRDGDQVYDAAAMEQLVQDQLRQYDRTGENHYDYISAFIKSIRGSDPDAALLYLAAMLEGGEDPLFIARRLMILAAEDVGNAAVQGLNLAVSTYTALERIGMPEGRIILAQCTTWLAAAPKSNAAYLAIDQAMEQVRGKRLSIPEHLRNAADWIRKRAGIGRDYVYPHDHPGAFVAQQYRPPEFSDTVVYRPGSNGQEVHLQERLQRLWPERYSAD